MVPFFIDTSFPPVLWYYYWLLFVLENPVHNSVDQIFIRETLWRSWKKEKMCCQVRWEGSISEGGVPWGDLFYFSDPKAQGCDVQCCCFQLVSISKCSPNTGPWGAGLVMVSPVLCTCGSRKCSHFFHRPHIVGKVFSSDLVPLSIEPHLISSI